MHRLSVRRCATVGSSHDPAPPSVPRVRCPWDSWRSPPSTEDGKTGATHASSLGSSPGATANRLAQGLERAGPGDDLIEHSVDRCLVPRMGLEGAVVLEVGEERERYLVADRRDL